MNILIINHYAGSPQMGMEYRPYYLAREWMKRGHDVTIICATYSHVRTNNPEDKQDFEEQICDGIRYVWIKTPQYDGNGLGRLKNMYIFVRKLLKYKKYIAKKYEPDAVIASSTYPSDNYPARKIANIAKAKHIYEVHDLWPLSPKELGGYSKYHPFILLMQHAENYAYKHGDEVVSMLPKTKDYMLSHGLYEDKWHYIPNGIVKEEWEQSTKLSEEHLQKVEELKKDGAKLVAYVGTHGLANDLYTLIECAKLVEEIDSSVHFVLVGKGPEKDSLKKFAEEKKVGNITFLPPVVKTAIPKLLSYFDLLYIGLKRESLFRFGISPNKLIDYMMAAKPVLMAIDAGNDMVSEAQCGLSVEPENPQAICDGILKILAFNIEKKKELGINGNRFVLENHTYEKLSDKFLDVMSK